MVPFATGFPDTPAYGHVWGWLALSNLSVSCRASSDFFGFDPSLHLAVRVMIQLRPPHSTINFDGGIRTFGLFFF
ncbi:uncharacterized protein BDR25DRAFT_354247 [Lindgomyces ingoldianus]|uniref:Uncharacterized protein n=1 Tax=Lindgomyces ingoldianus TaxID=673940 RepID=A0ACB6R098_9PLEO|nr:uncharacterized protein BDR25DRAFT_354247 [Lindgomyces ingoldianus]KAF2471757.1 hypothetical protein BDR25DRAFT_354247 [Lindgomyces ingoldianus]